MDNLREQVVKREKDVRYYINIVLIILAAIGIPAILVVIALVARIGYLIVAAFFVLLFCIYGAWYFITSLNVEYEYACLTSVIRFDKIINKRRRKPIVKFDIKSVSDFFRYTDEAMNTHRLTKVYRAGAKEFSEENYVAVFRSEARGECAVIFTPDEETINAIKPYFNAELKKKLFLNKQL